MRLNQWIKSGVCAAVMTFALCFAAGGIKPQAAQQTKRAKATSEINGVQTFDFDATKSSVSIKGVYSYNAYVNVFVPDEAEGLEFRLYNYNKKWTGFSKRAKKLCSLTNLEGNRLYYFRARSYAETIDDEGNQSMMYGKWIPRRAFVTTPAEPLVYKRGVNKNKVTKYFKFKLPKTYGVKSFTVYQKPYSGGVYKKVKTIKANKYLTLTGLKVKKTYKVKIVPNLIYAGEKSSNCWIYNIY